MRCATGGRYPRYIVWENVPGAFSSNKGEDFKAVLEAVIGIAEPETEVPMPEKNRWPYADLYMGEGWSLAYRTLDAQYWGVPQRRRRISVVADFGGDTAGEILFERKSVSRHPAESGTAGERLATGAEGGASYAVRIRGGCDGGGKGALVQEDKGGTLGIGKEGDPSPTLTAGDRHGVAYISGVDGYNGDLTGDVASTIGVNCGMSTGRNGVMELSANENGGMAQDSVLCAGFKLGNSEQARSIGYAEEQSPTLNAECGGNKPAVLCLNDQGGNVIGVSHDVSGTLRAQEHGHQPSILDMSHACDVIRDCGEVAPSLQARMETGGNQIPLTYQMQGFGDYCEGEVASSCKQRDFKDSTDLVCAVDCRNFREGGETNGTLQAKSNGGISYNLQNTVRTGMIVRRLTPMECERLQGYPDGWTDIGEWMDSKGKRHKDADSPRYKALGNSIALPFWDFLAKRISAQYLRPVTMGSLFDGIGGFPLVFERHNGKGTARWASEIEEFPIAVTKLRFGED
jgi:DNA (cytosine-5)-methyltransferase 1